MANEFRDQLIQWRHFLHKHPEKAFEEKTAAELVASEMRKMGIEVTEGIGGTGVVGTLKAGDGKTVIGLRADMDAICIQELGKHDHVSEIEGQMHGCGHDGHTITLLGAAKLLSESKDFNGTVRFIFQPAEEPGHGADAMIKDGLLNRFPMDEIYGMHNAPFVKEGHIATKPGGMMSSEDNFEIRITGKGGHASSPQEGVDPLACFSEIYMALQTIVSRNVHPSHPIVISCTEIETDGGHNVIPTHVIVRGDTRTTLPEDQALVERRMREIAEGVCKMNGATCEFIYTHEFVPLVNSPECVAHVVDAANKFLGPDMVDGNCDPWMASEDFAKFLHHIPGCFFAMGAGTSENPSENISLHQNIYDYNDNILEPGARFWEAFVKNRLR